MYSTHTICFPYDFNPNFSSYHTSEHFLLVIHPKWPFVHGPKEKHPRVEVGPPWLNKVESESESERTQLTPFIFLMTSTWTLVPITQLSSFYWSDLVIHPKWPNLHELNSHPSFSLCPQPEPKFLSHSWVLFTGLTWSFIPNDISSWTQLTPFIFLMISTWTLVPISQLSNFNLIDNHQKITFDVFNWHPFFFSILKTKATVKN